MSTKTEAFIEILIAICAGFLMGIGACAVDIL